MSNENQATTKAPPTPSFNLTPSQALKPSKTSGGKKGGSEGNTGNSSTANNANNTNAAKSRNNNNNNNRRRRNAKNANNKNNAKFPPTESTGNDIDAPNAAAAANTDTAKGNGTQNQNGKKQRQKQRQRQRGNKTAGTVSNENGGGDKGGGEPKGKAAQTNGNVEADPKPTPATTTTAKRKNNRRRKPKKKYPWRRHIPDGTVDPITLDNLDTLEYPPFALCADEPYVPVPEWPIPPEAAPAKNDGNEKSGTDSTPKQQQQQQQQQPHGNVEDLNRQRLADQWGEFMLPSKDSGTTNGDGNKPQTVAPSTPPPPLSQRPLNLFDGRALAFYMVSQLQFIDPFTRRDLTREELRNLDRYLDRYGSAGTDFDNNNNNNNNDQNGKQKKNAKRKKQKLRVTDAYDAKGITLSSAGAAAATAQGRADILQQMAQQLLNSLFVGQTSVASVPQTETTNERPSRRQQAENFSLQEQYAALQRQEREAAEVAERRTGFGFADAGFSSPNNNNNNIDDAGFGGFMIIDDDENPELRGRGHNDFPSLSAATPQANAPTGGATQASPFYSTSHISGRYGGQRTATGPGAFPALPRPAAEASSSATNAASKSKKSKTLSKISGIVKKTTAEEKQKQWDAREAARRKAMLSNLTYGMNPVVADPSRSLLAPPAAGGSGSATEEQLQRNRAFAEALGVKSAPQRHYASGWARPTTADGGGEMAANPEFRNELETALYSDGLIVSAREHRMDFLLKLEKRWKRFLNDDKAASLPLSKMERSFRKFVHEYAEFWHLKTESFDPEPNRYIHCVKLPDTRMPVPLLSDVARNWRGPSSLPVPDATRTIASIMLDHTSQQTAGQTSRSPMEVLRVPQKLRSATAMSSSKGDLVAIGEAAVQNSRSDGLIDKERPQLKLLPRTVPRELPPFEEQLQQEAEAALDMEEDIRRRQVRLEEKRRKEREIEQKKKHALEDAFASDDDESDRKHAGSSDSDSEWGDDQEALYMGSDEE